MIRHTMRLMSLLDDEKQEEVQQKERKLKEAAMKGSVPSLLRLLQEDHKILATTAHSLSDTPLHVASLLGHSDFVRELLSQRPELAHEPNSHGSLPLHLAAGKGYVEIVKMLVLVDPDMGSALDHDGRSPLHVAAVKGRVGVLTELDRVKPEATRVLTCEGESGLHLCVKYCRFEALKVLVECMGRDDEFVNLRDGNGDTVLHIAVAKKQLEVITYLLTNTKIDVNARNTNGFTPIDVLSHSTRDLRDMEIKEWLRNARDSRLGELQSMSYNQDGAKVSSATQFVTSKISSTKHHDVKPKNIDWLGRKRSALMVVTSLIATVTFQATISPPGGVWQDDYLVDSNGNPVQNPHKIGTSVMAHALPIGYRQFMIFNAIAYLSSLSIILLLVSGLPMKRRRLMWIQMVIMWMAISALTCTYFIALIYMTPDHSKGVLYNVTRVSVILWLCMTGVVVVGNVIRVILWLLRKYGYIQKKPIEDLMYIQDNENDDL